MKFDIILPTKGRDSLHAAISSVVLQEHQDWNLYVICDQFYPTDMLVQIWPDERIKWQYVAGPGNDSGAFARRIGIKAGSNEWIAYIDDDDEWHANHLTELIECARVNPSADMLKTAGQQFKWSRKSPRHKRVDRKLGPINYKDNLTVGMAHTRDIYDKTQGWQPVDNHDHLLWNDMLAAGGTATETETVTFLFKR